MNILPIDNVSGILSSLNYDGVLAFSKTEKLNKQKVYEATKVAGVAESIASNQLNLTLDEMDSHPVDWIRVISVGIQNNVADLVFLTYLRGFKEFFTWYVMKKMTEEQKTELITFLVNAHEIDALKLVGGIVNFDILYGQVLMGHKELVITVLEQIHNTIPLFGVDHDEAKAFVLELLEGRIDYRRRAFSALLAKDIIRVPTIDDHYNNTGKIKLYDGARDSIELNAKGMLDLFVPDYEFRSYSNEKVIKLVKYGNLLPKIALKIFVERPAIVTMLLTDYKEVREDVALVSLIVSTYSQRLTAMMDKVIEIVPINVLEQIDLPEKYAKMLQYKKRDNFNTMVIKAEYALVNGDLDKLVANFTSLADIKDSIPKVTKPEILSFLKMKGFRLASLSEKELLRMIDNLPDYVALFNIFNDDSGTALTLLRKYNDRFTTDDILNLGFPLSEMLKALEVEDIGDSEMMMSELMYSDGPENIKEAVMAKLLN